MKIVWHSPPIWISTGYGVQSYYFTKALQSLGHDVRLSANCQLISPPIMTYDGIPHYPCGPSLLGVDAMLRLCEQWHPDMVISLMDVWPLVDDIGRRVEQLGAGGWYPYAPVDHDPIPDVVASKLVYSKMPLAMSQFAVRAMSARVAKVPWYLPHVIDTQVYRPLKDAPQNFGPDKFVVGMVAMNMSPVDRKGFQPAIRTFAKFEKNHPDALLYLHCNPFKGGPDIGQDLVGLAKALGTGFSRPDPVAMEWGVSPQMLAGIYNNFDVLLAPSKGEGFCIPLIEAQACGVPVITTAFTATEELGKNGWLIPPASKNWMGASSWQANPDEDAILTALEEAYDMKKSSPDKWLDKKMAAHDFAQQYDIQVVLNRYLIPLLDIVEHEPKKPIPRPVRKVSKKSHKKHQ